MTRRTLLLCAAVWCCLSLCPADAQTGSPANRQGHNSYSHDDEHDAAPAPQKAIDEAVADLLHKISGVRLKSGPLDMEGLKKAFAEKLQGLKPPDRLKVTSSAYCNVVDSKDVGGYWSAPGVRFAKTQEDKQVWQTKLNIDEKEFALSGPPLAELRYNLIGRRLGSGAEHPYGKAMSVLTDYYMNVTVTVTFDAQSVADGTGGTFSGIGSGNADPCTFTGTVSLIDRKAE